MSVPKTPAMPLYGKDAYDDEAFSRLTFAEQGLYWYLAWWQWQEGSIPGDLDAILDKLPRRKGDEATAAWAAVSKLFPSLSESLSDRRANPTVERNRLKAIGERGRRQFGAELTNTKRWGNRENEKRAETALESTNSDPAIPTHVPTPDFALAAKIHAQTEASGLKVPPPLQLVIAWAEKFGEELITETLADCAGHLSGKHFNYLAQILSTRKEDPSQRPGRRDRNRQVTGNNGDGSAKGPDGLVIPQRPDDYWS